MSGAHAPEHIGVNDPQRDARAGSDEAAQGGGAAGGPRPGAEAVGDATDLAWRATDAPSPSGKPPGSVARRGRGVPALRWLGTLGRWLQQRWRRGLALGLALGATLSATLVVATTDRVRLDAPAPTIQLVDRHGRFLGERSADDRLGFWPVDPLPPRVVAATLAAEDQDFFDHPGVDVAAAARAAWQNVTHGRRVSGASTLAMQVARMQDPAPRTWRAKALEAATALRLVARFGHRAILAHYLRIAPYGNNIHGIGYAARRYFDKPVRDLSWAQVAFLTALPQGPGLMNPYREAGRALAVERARWILGRLRDRGDLDPPTYAQAEVELGRLVPPPAPVRPDATLHALFAPELSGPGPRVHSTLDLDLQTTVQTLLRRHVDRLSDRGAGNAAALVVDLATHEVRAAVGSVDWHDGTRDGAVDYTRARRGGGSTLKPFLYALALDRGALSPTEPLADLPRPEDDVQNGDHRFLGPMLPAAALGNSRNVPAVDLIERVGLHAFESLLRDLGLIEGTGNAEHHGVGLALGAAPIRLVDLAQAYLTLAGDGTRATIRWQMDDRDAAGSDRRDGAPASAAGGSTDRDALDADVRSSAPGVRGPTLIEPATAHRVARWLSVPLARIPTFPRGGHGTLPFAVALKTGTTASYRDAWTVAWSQRYLVAVWMGHPSGQPTRGVSGYRGAAAAAHDLLVALHPDAMDGLTDLPLPAPEGTAPHRVCAQSGKRATPACEHTTTVHLSHPPAEACDWHVRVYVDRRDGHPARPSTPARHREARTFHTLPPAYHAWMRTAGLEPPPGFVAPPDAKARPRVRITSPVPDAHVVADPEAAPGTATLRLEARVDPPVPQLVWYVDGAPFAVADHPYAIRWPIAPGAHTFEARLPFSEQGSPPVRVVAR